MSTIIFISVYLSCALAQTHLNWTDIRAVDVFLDPVHTAPVAPGEKIIGGTQVAPNSIPYQVALIIDSTSFCGGSLISRDWILTAAHCTSGASFIRAILGAHNIRRSEATQIVVTSSNIINHPQYSRPTLSNDISLIRLPYSVPLSRAIQTVRLAPANSGVFAGYIARLSGWGKTADSAPAVASILSAVSVYVIPNNLCQRTFGGLIRPSTVCTYGGGIVGGCHGDSGGPLIVGGFQIGIVSFVSTWGCQSGTPTAYSRISFFRNWITAHTGI